MLPQLHGVDVWFIGVSTDGKPDGRFFRSQEAFFRTYVQAAGGRLKAFSRDMDGPEP
jgi:hypothetical protein